jgi:23S rRNA (guanosine2251-2'-O)-methyltransferase
MGRQRKGDIETNYEVRSHDAKVSLEEYNSVPKNPLYVILDNLRSAFNVGSIFRLCDGLRVQGLCLCGHTPYPPHVKLKKTSLGTIDFVPWRHFDETNEAVIFLKKQGVAVFAAETTSMSVPYCSIAYPLPVGVVFGNEITGVSRQVLEACDCVIELPMYGFKNSLNVAASAAVICYRIVEQAEKKKAAGHADSL